MSELKPCPMCGQISETRVQKGKTLYGRVYDYFYVICTNPDCEIRTPDFSTQKKAARCWNRRVRA